MKKKISKKTKKKYVSLMAAISVSMIAVIVLLCASLGGTSISRSDKALKNAASDSMSNFTNQAANDIGNTIEGYYKELDILTSDDVFSNITANKDKITARLIKFAKVMGNTDVIVSDKNGNAYSMMGNSVNIADSDYFKSAISGSYYISDPLVGKDTGNLELYLSAPIRSSSGELVGVIAACRDGNELSNMIANVTYGKSGKAFMIDSDGITVAHSNKELVINRENDLEKVKTDPSLHQLAEIEKKMVSKETGLEQYKYNNEANIVSFHPVDGTNFSLALAAPVSEVYSASKKLAASIILFALIFLAISIALSIYLAYLVSQPYKKVSAVTANVAAGDLTTGLNHKPFFKEEVALVTSINNMVENLNIVLSNIDAAADQVASGSKHISSSSISLSQGASEQASSVEELTASIEEITSQTVRNAEDAKETNKLTVEITKSAEICKSSMKTLLEAMSKISASSKSITKIAKSINEIAMQTNMLSLNAAVEAAKAGESGKGFGVVADEIRELANRSAKAAKETSVLVENSINNIGSGEAATNETAHELDTIVEKITSAAALIESISTASNEQALGLSQVNQGIIQVSSVVQSNSAASEESAAASEELSGQAEMLKQQVDTFKLRGRTSAEGAPAEDKPQEPVSKNKEKEAPREIFLSKTGFGKY
ncbi:MAG: methyl-accepting chemotaxis protein [Bacillota bacterium]|nr:methyl-accepting chemotaxis protein [Bacillota bacterium]